MNRISKAAGVVVFGLMSSAVMAGTFNPFEPTSPVKPVVAAPKSTPAVEKAPVGGGIVATPAIAGHNPPATGTSGTGGKAPPVAPAKPTAPAPHG
jgi:hypothetical protein